jgi:hypothetical protein
MEHDVIIELVSTGNPHRWRHMEHVTDGEGHCADVLDLGAVSGYAFSGGFIHCGLTG